MSETSGPGRRGFLQALAVGAGAGLALPGHAASQAAHAHPASAPAEAPPDRVFLDPHQLETLPSLAEAIVPGSTAAGVAPFVDQLLAKDTPEAQQAFLAALGAIQAESAARYGKPWLGLEPSRKPSSSPPRRRARPRGSRATGPPAAGAGARAAAGAAHAPRPLRPAQGADRHRLLQLGGGHEGSRLDRPPDPRVLPRLPPPRRARALGRPARSVRPDAVLRVVAGVAGAARHGGRHGRVPRVPVTSV